MTFSAAPFKKYSEISYRVKCVAVESERVFDNITVAQQTRNIVYRADAYHFPPIYRKDIYNQVHEILDSPDFMKLNSREQRKKNEEDSWPRIDDRIGRTNDRKPKIYPSPLPQEPAKQEIINSLVDQLLSEIYGFPGSNRCPSESDSPASSLLSRPHHEYLQKTRLQLKSQDELQVLVLNLREHISHAGGLLVRYLRKRDYLLGKRDKQCSVITAHLQAHSLKTFEDTKMRFSLTPQPGESGFQQWLDAMKMVARLQGGIPPEFRKRLWLTLAERHLEQRGVDWKQAEKICFNEWSNPDDEELGIQIVKDLHRTGCSLFCGAAGRDNQAVLRRVLLGFARWNKSVGYCQGLNVLAALVLQVMDRAESSAVKVMIYLIEGVLPEGYFADNLRGLSIDMAVFRDLLRARLPKLSKHLEVLQNDGKDKATGSSYEPPLTNVFTMQWFLTLFCHCLPQDTVLRVWDLIFLEGDQVLLRTALAIWEGLSDRIMTVTSADEFYSIMGVLTREMLEFTDTNNLIKNIVSMAPLHNVTGLREKHRYNITPWARKLSDDDDSDTEEDERLAVAAAMFSMAQRLKKDCVPSTVGALQSMATSTDRERLALDISTLKQQYAKLRERQRQAHIILSAACTRQSMVSQPTSQAMNHLLVGKNALVSGKSRSLGLFAAAVPQKTRPIGIHSPRTQNRKDRQGITLHWRDTKKPKQKPEESTADCTVRSDRAGLQPPQKTAGNLPSPAGGKSDSDSDSTSTELCDEPDRLSDVDSEDQTSTSDCFVTATDEDINSGIDSVRSEGNPDSIDKPKINITEELNPEETASDAPSISDISVAKITDHIRRLSAEGDLDLGKSTAYEEEEASRMNFPSASQLLVPHDSSNQADIFNSSEQSTNELGDSPTKTQEDEPSEFNDVKAKEANLGDAEIRGEKNIDDSKAVVDDFVDILDDPSYQRYGQKFTLTETADEPEKIVSKMTETPEARSTGFYEKYRLSETRQEDMEMFADNDSNSRRLRYSDKSYTVTEITEGKEHKENGFTFYSSSYVVGHFPISPLSVDQKLQQKLQTFDSQTRPKTPDSLNSSSPGETTMGPESKASSLTVSPRTPLKSESRDLLLEKSGGSSLSSDSKTLVLENTDSKRTTYDKSSPCSPMSMDSLKNKSEASPRLVASSSSDSCSLGKIKSSERSFSSDLQSPISANSIKYTTNYNRNDDIIDSPLDVCIPTSPFYPIGHPDEKTPSPYSLASKRRTSVENAIFSPEQKSTNSNGASKYSSYKLRTDLNLSDITLDSRDSNVDVSVGKLYGECIKYPEEDVEELSEKDDLPQLPRDKLDKHYYNYRHEKPTRLPFERSCSSLERTCGDLKPSTSTDELKNNTAKKRSSDILQDMKHLEAKANDESPSSSLLTKKSSHIWEDMKNLEARRQDTFADSASTFSKRVLDRPELNVMGEQRRNSYVVRPKINIDETSDSILKSFSREKDKDNGDSDDGRESKLGVWTKVKPRKKGDNGRRSSDRALKIIQENSVILHKILACQAKKRLPDLEEISKEITISPINEEISKIFSPILEKMGLNEHEINEELARINFKDFDDAATTNVSEFDAKINDELSKLSLIDDTEEIERLGADDLTRYDYLDTREALIDRKINEELSKLLANYEENSPASMATHDKSSSQNISDLDGLDLTSISTNVFSYKSSNDSIETRSEMGSFHEQDKPTQYKDNILPYSSAQYPQDLSPKSDIDIYRELEKLDKISSVQVIPESSPVRSKGLSPVKYGISSPYTYESSAMNPTYEPYKSYEFMGKISPVKTASLYSSRIYEKTDSYSFMEEKAPVLQEEYDPRKSILSKENLEFRVRYDDEPIDSPIPKQSYNSNKGIGIIPYYDEEGDKPATPTKYTGKDDSSFETAASALDEMYQRKYNNHPLSPKDYDKSPDFNRRSNAFADHGTASGSSYLGLRHRESHSLSPSRQFPDGQPTISHYPTKFSPTLSDDTIRPVSHPEFPEEMPASREFTSDGATCYDKSSLSLGNIGYGTSSPMNVDSTPSPKAQFSPFPVRNVPRKPKELTIKLGLYSQKPTTDIGQSKKS